MIQADGAARPGAVSAVHEPVPLGLVDRAEQSGSTRLRGKARRVRVLLAELLDAVEAEDRVQADRAELAKAAGIAAAEAAVEEAEVRAQIAALKAKLAGRSRARCGTPSGYTRHRRLKEPPCRPCKDATNAYERERRARRG